MLRRRIQELEAENRRPIEVIARLEARIAILEGWGSGPAGPRAASLASKTPPAELKKSGRSPGHEGASWSIPSDIAVGTVDLKLRCCPERGGGLTKWRGRQDHFVLDLPPIPPERLSASRRARLHAKLVIREAWRK